MKSIHGFDEYVGESTSINPPQNGEAITPTSDDPDQYYSSSSESSTSATIAKNHSRKRRSKKLIRQFRELSSIVLASSNKEVSRDKDPSSILEDAIKYMKELEERVNKLEEDLTRPNYCGSDHNQELLEIEVKTDDQDQQNVLIRIICDKQKGHISRIISEIEKLHLSVSNISALPFGDHFLVITVSAQMGNESCMTAKDLQRNLQLALVEVM